MRLFWITVIFVALVLFGCAYLAFANSPGSSYVNLTWQWGGTGTVTYNVYRASTLPSCGTGDTPLFTGITSTSFTDSTVTAGQTYGYQVTAVVGGAESACSSGIQIAVPSVPLSPNNLQGTTQ